MGLLHRLLVFFHLLKPSKCIASFDSTTPIDDSLWRNNELRCVKCGRLIAYRFFQDHSWQVHICIPMTIGEETEIRLSTERSVPSASEYEAAERENNWGDFFELIHARDPEYDAIALLSDSWTEEQLIENGV